MGLTPMVTKIAATDHTALMMLLNWMSPTFPIGSFAYSHGLEQTIVDGRITNAEDVETWIADLLQRGTGWNDAVMFAQCWSTPIDDLNELALALAGSAERYMEATHLGRNFNIAASVWTGAEKSEAAIAYPVAAGQACKAMGIDQHQALIAYLQGFCSALVSVAVRLVPLGQTNGLIVMRNLAPLLSTIAGKAAAASSDNIGTSCIASEIAAMQHETLQPRIFRT
jgi:urease accessory protein